MTNILLIIFIIYVKINYISMSDVLDVSDEFAKCTLIENEPIKPVPSLSKCYRYNFISCCHTVHDYYINEKLKSLLTQNCLSKYPALVDLFCMFCSPYEPYVTNFTSSIPGKKKVKICLSFVKQLWTDDDSLLNNTFADINKPTTKFDSCGFKRDDNFSIINKNSYIMPSKEYKNASDFLNRIGIPYLDESEIEIYDDINDSVPDGTDDSIEDMKLCFKKGSFLKIGFYVYFFLFFLYW